MKTYRIIPPAIQTGEVYHFITGSGLLYEVRFNRKKNSFSTVTVNFGVLDEEFNGDEYAVTNRGEVFSVLNTVAQIIKMYDKINLYIKEYTFCGQSKNNETQKSIRTRLYERYIRRLSDSNLSVDVTGNALCIKKIKW